MQLCLICGSAKISVSRIFSGLFFANSILDHLYLSSDILEIAKTENYRTNNALSLLRLGLIRYFFFGGIIKISGLGYKNNTANLFIIIIRVN